jgi:hypothetical protein
VAFPAPGYIVEVAGRDAPRGLGGRDRAQKIGLDGGFAAQLSLQIVVGHGHGSMLFNHAWFVVQ